MSFSQAAYELKEWRSALDKNLFQRLGLQPSPNLSEEDVRRAYLPRYQWWQHKQDLLSTGQQPPIIGEVGPYVSEALRNLGEARTILANLNRCQEYYSQWVAHLEEEWYRDLEGMLNIAIDDGWLTPGEKSGILQVAASRGIPSDKAEEILNKLIREKGIRYGNKPEFSLSGTYYELLEISRTASRQDIEAAYRREHQRYINDRDKARASARFHMVTQAYETLRDPSKRNLYDEKLRQNRKPETKPGDIPGHPCLEFSLGDGGVFQKTLSFKTKQGETASSPQIKAKNGGGGALDAEIKIDVPWLEAVDPNTGTVLKRINQAMLPQPFYLRVVPSRDKTLTFAARRNGVVEFIYKSRGIQQRDTITVNLEIETLEERVYQAVTVSLVLATLLDIFYLYLLENSSILSPLSMGIWDIIPTACLSLMFALLLVKRNPGCFWISIGWGLFILIGSLFPGVVKNLFFPFLFLGLLPLPLSVITVKIVSARQPYRSTVLAIVIPVILFLLFWLSAHALTPSYNRRIEDAQKSTTTEAELILDTMDKNTSNYLLHEAEELYAELQFMDQCWVRVQQDGVVVYEKTYTDGDNLQLDDCDTLHIRIGAPNAVNIKINGHILEIPGPNPHNIIVKKEID